jgi:hypothetical protein
VKCREFLYWMGNCQLLKSNSAISAVLLLTLPASDMYGGAVVDVDWTLHFELCRNYVSASRLF